MEISSPILASEGVETIRVYIKPDENILGARHLKKIAIRFAIIPTHSVSINLPSIIDIVDHEDLIAFDELRKLKEKLAIISIGINRHL